ncbi:MAG: hypothetical protein QXZ68_04955 [Candidatus Bathyarchaeia archaeon]
MMKASFSTVDLTALDYQYYYFRVTDLKKDYEYDNWNRYVDQKLESRGVGVLYWLRAYERWLRMKVQEGRVRYPELYTRAIKQTTLEEFVSRAEEWKKRLEETRGEKL